MVGTGISSGPYTEEENYIELIRASYEIKKTIPTEKSAGHRESPAAQIVLELLHRLWTILISVVFSRWFHIFFSPLKDYFKIFASYLWFLNFLDFFPAEMKTKICQNL